MDGNHQSYTIYERHGYQILFIVSSEYQTYIFSASSERNRE